MLRRSSSWTASICAALLLGVAGTARADAEAERARELVYRGDDLVAAGKLDDALSAYRQADAIVSAPTTSIEVASVLVSLRRFVEARAIARGLSEAPAATVEPEPFVVARRRARDMIVDIDARAPSLTVAVPTWASATWVRVDHAAPVAVGALPLQMDPGAHLLTFEGDAIEPTSVRVELVERDRKHLDLTPEPRRQPDVSTLTIVSFVVSGVGLVTAAAAGGAYLSLRGDVADACEVGGPDCTGGARDGADAAGWVANVGMGVFVAGAVFGSVSLAVDLSSGGAGEEQTGSVQAVVAPGALFLRGTF